MIKYPKIQSLWHREGASYTKEQLESLTVEQKQNRHRFIEDKYSCQEFDNIKRWIITEKIDGMNIRIHYKKGYLVTFSGRTDSAMLPPILVAYLNAHFTTELFEKTFIYAEEVILFGEGYGPKIQKGGENYCSQQRFVLFDILIDRNRWLEYDYIIKLADIMGIPSVPLLRNEEDSIDWSQEEIISYVKSNPTSIAATKPREIEGIVARAYPMMLTRDGTPIKFKLKCKDFR